MQSNHVTNATRPLPPESHPMAAGGDAGGCGDKGIRKTGNQKIAIPEGSLADCAPHWPRPHGVGRAAIDYAIKGESIFACSFEKWSFPKYFQYEIREKHQKSTKVVKNGPFLYIFNRKWWKITKNPPKS